METRKFTLREFIDNIEKNGLPQAFGGLFKGFISPIGTKEFLEAAVENYDNYVITSACAMGQGFINTGVHPFNYIDSESDFYADILPTDIIGTIVRLNDTDHAPFSVIANELRSLYQHRLDEVYEGVVVNYKTA